MKLNILVGISILAGIVITLSSYLWYGTALAAGPTLYGFPFSWAGVGGLGPTTINAVSINWPGLILDIVIWSIIIFAILFSYTKLTKKSK